MRRYNKGQVVVLNRVDPDRLPAMAVSLRANVFENPDGFEDDVGAGVKSHRPSATKKLNAVDYIASQSDAQAGRCRMNHATRVESVSS